MIKIQIIDEKLNQIEIEWKKNCSILDLAEENKVDLYRWCSSWACWICRTKIVEWWEFLDQNLCWEPLIQLNEWEFLTCVWWIKNNINDGWIEKKIVLKIVEL